MSNAAPNEYETRVSQRLERLRSRAERKRAEAEGTIEKARAMASVIPFGEPIHVGHHSEGRDRRYRAKIDRTFTRGFEALQEARDLDRRADAAEANRTISSDDPDAIVKLRAKLDAVEGQREQAAQVNAKIRAAKRRGEGWEDVARAELAALGLKPTTIDAALAPDFAGRRGVPAYALTNLSAEARRIRDRIAALERERATAPTEAATFGAIRVEEGDNRVRIVLPARPTDAARALLKSRGFRWSPTAGAWQRQATDNARRDARELARKLAEHGEST